MRETARIAEARLGVDHLPEALAKLIVAKAEGNALFAEEIASFLVERGIVRRSATGLDFDPAAVAAALPESVQSLLASRVDRLAPSDRNLLQTAAVVGRRFDPDLVAWSAGRRKRRSLFRRHGGARLIHRAEGSNEYVFKHALVRDALYNGLLSGARATLHLKVAEELERRGGNRLTEIAESPRTSLCRDRACRQGVHVSCDGGRQEPRCLFDLRSRAILSTSASFVRGSRELRRPTVCGPCDYAAAGNAHIEK